jgi:hypothetical protein
MKYSRTMGSDDFEPVFWRGVLGPASNINFSDLWRFNDYIYIIRAFARRHGDLYIRAPPEGFAALLLGETITTRVEAGKCGAARHCSCHNLVNTTPRNS